MSDLYTTIIKSCLPYMRSDATTCYCMLLWLQENMESLSRSEEVTHILLENYHLFLYKGADPSYLLSIKLELLKLFVNDKNITEIVENVRSAFQLPRIEKQTAEHLLQFVSDINMKFPDKCLSVVQELLSSQFESVVITLLKYLHHFMDYDDSKLEEYTLRMLRMWRQLTEIELLALLNLCIHFAFKQSGSLEYMQQILTHVTSKSCNSLSVKCLLGKALVTCYKNESAEYSSLLKLYLAKFHQSDNVVLNEQVKWCIAELKLVIRPS